MKRFLPLPFIFTLVSAALLDSNTALACSVGENFDPVASSEVIVEGRITGWEDIEDAIEWNPKTDENDPSDNENYYGPYDAIRFDLEVQRVLKGDVHERIALVSGNTLQTFRGERLWVGSSGACGAFNDDPTGKWVVLGLHMDQHGRYTPSLPLTFFVGDAPMGDRYAERMDMIETVTGPGGPPKGLPPQPDAEEHEKDTPWAVVLPLAFAIPVAVLLIPAFLRKRTAGH